MKLLGILKMSKYENQVSKLRLLLGVPSYELSCQDERSSTHVGKLYVGPLLRAQDELLVNSQIYCLSSEGLSWVST